MGRAAVDLPRNDRLVRAGEPLRRRRHHLLRVRHLTPRAREFRILFLFALLAGVLLRAAVVNTPGFPTDVQTYQAWAERLRDVGPPNFYAPNYFSDYPPAYLYVLWLVAGALGGMPAIVAKALSIPFDLAIAVALYLLVARLAHERAAAVAAALYVLNPALVLAGPYWGQVDAVGTLPLLLALVAAAFGRFGLAGALAAVALMVKPQYGVGLAVVLAAALFDLLLNRRAGPLLRSAAASVAVVLVLALPFRMTLTGERGLLDLVGSAAATYEYTSLYAFNIWAIVSDFWKPDDQLLLGVAMRYWSAGLFAVGFLAILAVLWRAAPRGRAWGSAPVRDVGVMLATGTLLVLAFYFLPTRVHERYLFPFFALAAPLAAVHRRVLWTHLAFAAFFFLTVFYAFTRYPQTNTTPPDLLEATLYQRNGGELLSLFGIGLAAALAWWWARGEHREVIAPPVEDTESLAAAVAASRPPRPLGLGRRPTRRDLIAAFILALLVLLTRSYRLDWPRDMYFDEVYHARTAMEMLAGREYYEWTHPHLAKEAMALSILVFGDVRATGTTEDPAELTAFAVDGDGRRAYALGDELRVVDADGHVRDLGKADAEVKALALAGDDLVVLTARQVAVVPIPGGAARSLALPEETRALAVSNGRIFVATIARLAVYSSGLTAQLQVPAPDIVALEPMTDRPIAYLASGDGTVRSVSYISGETERQWQAGAPVATLTLMPEACPAGRGPTDRCDHLFLGDARSPILHSLDLESGGVEHVPLDSARLAPFAGAPRALAFSPRARMVWVLGSDGAAVVEPHGTSAFAVARGAAGARFLGIDDANDAVLAAGGIPGTRIESGRIAFAWRFPGVVAGAILAFFLYLLARRLFAAPYVAYALGALVLADGAMFAQSRIGMNDIYTAAGIVGGWYFVAAALHPDARRPWLDVLLAGVAFGLGLAAKWAAGPALLAVGLVAVFVTARAFVEDRVGRGGPLDLLRWRGLNALYLAFCFVAVPVAIYLVSYLPWLGLGHGITESPNGGWSLIELQKQMYSYHSGLTAPHPAGSPWWAWPLDLKPVYWEYEQAANAMATYIYDAGNLVTWWAAIPAFVWFLWVAIRTRAWNLALVALAFGTQYLEWIPVTRVIFQYHFFTALPFYLVGLAAALAVLWESADRRRWLDGAVAGALFIAGVVFFSWLYPAITPFWVFGAVALFVILWSHAERRPHLAGALVAGVIVGGALWFAWFYPWLSAVPVSGTLANYYFWLPTWQYGCQFYPSFRCT
ncbi:MAG: hypothetical protein AUH85_14500 [Chloroflexi bacterium 13_1_40CM_4_68_4]|nr:MAG: hypothetical protein AUH85_14500 [Chloroflexi bacterium 13_1_40CM_4_68_4]